VRCDRRTRTQHRPGAGLGAIKFKGHDDYAQLDVLKREMPHHVESFQLLHLCSNKNEACVFGTVGDGPLKNAG